MDISIIVIGDELLIGQVTDTNSGEIARHIAPEGWTVAQVQVVADEAEAISRAIGQAFGRTRVVITTGGLGPTKDDITKQVLCREFGGELRRDESVLENVKQVIEKRGLKLNDLTRAQADVPTSCRVIQNRVGTAPIMWFDSPRGVLVAMPGVPFETREMFASEVFPQLLRRFPSDEAVEHRTLKVTGISESALAERIAEWEMALPEHAHLAYLPRPGVVRLRIDVRHTDRAFAMAEADRLHSELCASLYDLLLTDRDESEARTLLRLLQEHGLTVSTAESCTGGNIAHLITLEPGSSAAMLGGVVSYANSVKTGILGVNPEAIESVGAVSELVAGQMAQGVCRATGADLGISTSGIAGPGGATPGKPVGTVCMGVCLDGQVWTYTFHFPGSRDRVIDRASYTALILGIRALKQKAALR